MSIQQKVDALYLQFAMKNGEPDNIFENIQNGVCLTDKDSKIIYANPAYSRITGYEPKELIGANPGILHSGHHKAHFYEEMWKSIHEEGHWEGEIWNRRKEGEVYPSFLTISRITGDNPDDIFYMGISSDISFCREDDYRKLHFFAYYDPVTGLPNRTLFSEQLRHNVSLVESLPDSFFALLFLDLDKFKQVNDQFGHLAGDQLLVEVGRRLSGSIRTSDTVARLGGDEFVIILNGIKDKDTVIELTQRFISDIEKPFKIDGHEMSISVSIGVCFYPGSASTQEDLLRHADEAMYAAKRSDAKFVLYVH